MYQFGLALKLSEEVSGEELSRVVGGRILLS